MDTKENKIKQTKSFDYVNALRMDQIAPFEVKRRVFTDTYVSAEASQEGVLTELDNVLETLQKTDKGVVGFLTFWYAMITLHYLIHRPDLMETDINYILDTTTTIEKIVFTDDFSSSGFVNMTFGGDLKEEEMTLKYANDTYNTANLVHQKAASFESSYALIVSLFTYHYAMGSKKEMMDDIANLRKVLNEMKKEIQVLKEKETHISEEFVSFENIEN